MTTHTFPPAGFLTLGILSIAASVLFLVRAATIEATTERIWSALAFGVVGIVMLAAYWASHHTSHR
jgi:hypothetical protein